MIQTMVFDFSPSSDMSNWRIVDDGVMGGLSQGHIDLNEKGHAVYHGKISLQNNGGFSSLRYRPEPFELSNETHLVLRVKGDGKKYQFRIKSRARDSYSYIHYHKTSGEWETIRLPLSEFSPSFRGRRLDRPNYPAETVAEIGILIGNKKAEPFEIQIDWVGLD
jgi:hypothetical protein